MKKVITLALALAVLFTLCACGEPAAVFASSGYYLEDEYQVHPLHKDDIHIAACVKYTFYYLGTTSMIIDFDSLTYTLTHPVVPGVSYSRTKEETLKAQCDKPWLHLNGTTRTALLNDFVNYLPLVIDPYELVSASGSLYLAG